MKIIKPISILIVSALLGLLFGQAEVFGLMKIFLLLISILLIGVVVFIIGVIRKKTKTINLGSLSVLFAIITGISTLAASSVKKSYKEETAEKLIREIEIYKDVNGTFPVDLQKIGYKKQEYNYSVDSTSSNYKLRYLVDGWHYREYSSKTEKWISGD